MTWAANEGSREWSWYRAWRTFFENTAILWSSSNAGRSALPFAGGECQHAQCREIRPFALSDLEQAEVYTEGFRMNDFANSGQLDCDGRKLVTAAKAWLMPVLLICLVAAAPVSAEERPCQINERPDGTLTVQDPVFDTVRGGIGRTRERAYITPRLEHDAFRLRVERTDGRNDGFFVVCVYDDDRRQAVQVRMSQEQVWASNILELTRGSVGESAESPVLEDLQGRRLIVMARTLSSARQRTFSYRISLHPAASTATAAEAAEEDIGSVVHPQYQPEETGDARDDQARLRGPAEAEARDERAAPASSLQPDVPERLDEIAFGPMQDDDEGYFRAPAFAPVGSLVPVDITYHERRRFDNLILVRADAPGSAMRRPSGRNAHLIEEADTVYRRGGDEPGLYEIRLRRHAGADRRIMARQHIELVDINIDLQVPDAVAPGEPFEVNMNPVMNGHLVITSPDRDPENLVGRNSQRSNAIEDADGPGVFTRNAPSTTGEYEVRFHFTPPTAWQEHTGRQGRLMARATLNVVDADSLVQAEPGPASTTEPAAETSAEPEAPAESAAEVETEAEAESAAAEQASYTEDCVGFNPQNLEARAFGDGGARLLDGSHALMAFSSADDADDALQVIQHYGFNRSCYVGRPNPSMHYFLVDGNPPEGGFSGEDCLRINPDRVEVARAQGSWKLVQGNRWLMDFGNAEEEARQALWVVRHHGFTHSCFVARPDPALTYMRR